MTTDLRDLLELASDDVPETDLATDAWETAVRHRRTVRRRALLGAGAVAAAAAVTSVVVRETPSGTGVAGRPTPSPTRLRNAVVGGVTADLAPDPGDETALPLYRDAATLGLATLIGFDDAMRLPKLGAEAGRPTNTASVRAVMLAWTPGAEGLMAVLHLPRAAAGLDYLVCSGVPLVRADPTQSGGGIVLGPRTIRDDRLAVVLPQPGEVVVIDARNGTADRIPVPDSTIHRTGWAKDNRTVVAHGTDRTWLVDTAEGTVAEATSVVGAGWVDLVTVDGVTELRTFSAAGASTGSRSLRGPVIEVDGESVSNTEAWVASHAYLGQTYGGAIARSQGLIAVQGDLRPIPRVLAATRSPAVPKGCYRPLAWGPQDVVILESRSFAGLSARPTLRLLAWDVIGGGLSRVGEVGPVGTNAGGFTGSYAL
ncbi:hypothetical protein [Oryzobacter telluris]|uniref:hypothetical protein n=1 Tax=Oryzobacter telluris TaxID=3149179 RepID=UPI00370DD70C